MSLGERSSQVCFVPACAGKLPAERFGGTVRPRSPVAALFEKTRSTLGEVWVGVIRKQQRHYKSFVSTFRATTCRKHNGHVKNGCGDLKRQIVDIFFKHLTFKCIVSAAFEVVETLVEEGGADGVDEALGGSRGDGLRPGDLAPRLEASFF